MDGVLLGLLGRQSSAKGARKGGLVGKETARVQFFEALNCSPLEQMCPSVNTALLVF